MKREEKIIKKINQNCEYEPNFDLIKNKIEYQTKTKKNFSLMFKRVGLSFACVFVLAFGFAMIILPNTGKNASTNESGGPSPEHTPSMEDGRSNVIKGVKVYTEDSSIDENIGNIQKNSLAPYSSLDSFSVATAFSNVYSIEIKEFDIVYLEEGSYFIVNAEDRELILSEDEVKEANESK